jgi:hypothetical protein
MRRPRASSRCSTSAGVDRSLSHQPAIVLPVTRMNERTASTVSSISSARRRTRCTVEELPPIELRSVNRSLITLTLSVPAA